MIFLFHSRRAAAALLLLCLAATGCNDDDVRKAARAADGIASGLAGVQKVNVILYQGELISKDETKAIAVLVQQGTLANDEFIAKARTLRDLDPGNKALMLQWFGEVSASLDKLNREGVLHVKNPEAQARLSVAFASVKAGADIIASLLGGAQ